jgi:hypothetical protein
MYKTIFVSRCGKARVLEHSETGALRFDYELGDFKCSYSLWAEVGERAAPMFNRFWQEKGIKNPLLELVTVDHGAAKPYVSDRLPA